MSARAVVLLEGMQAWVLPARGAVTALTLSATRPVAAGDVPDLTPVRDALAASDSRGRVELVLVVGGAWLSCAQPALPPLAPADRRRALHHQADRFFAMRGPIASTVYAQVSVACEASWLAAVDAQCATWAAVRAIIGVPEAAAAVLRSGRWHTDASRTPDAAATLLLELRDGDVVDARVTRGSAATASSARAESRPLERESLLRGVQQVNATEWPRDRQLLDVAGDAALARAEHRAWWRAAALLVAAIGLLTWAVAQRRERLLAAAEAAQQAAAAEAAPALAAQARLQRAAQEGAWLADAPAASLTPSQVIATLGQQIPASAFVQHLEWDGQQWKIDGSAVDAAGLIPRLDAVPAFAQVRSLAPSTRFMDGGTARGSFSIGFVLRGAASRGAARGE
jgi:hypothetical protein